MQLTQAELTQQNQQKYTITGAVDFSTAPGLMKQAAAFFKPYKQSASTKVEVDLSQITDCNSAGLALMLEMVKDARRNNIDLYFKNLPEALLTIAKAYGVESEIREFSQ